MRGHIGDLDETWRDKCIQRFKGNVKVKLRKNLVREYGLDSSSSRWMVLMAGFSENATESSGFLKGGSFMFIGILLPIHGLFFTNVINLSNIQGGEKGT
jgi:hypothetical protein